MAIVLKKEIPRDGLPSVAVGTKFVLSDGKYIFLIDGVQHETPVHEVDGNTEFFDVVPDPTPNTVKLRIV